MIKLLIKMDVDKHTGVRLSRFEEVEEDKPSVVKDEEDVDTANQDIPPDASVKMSKTNWKSRMEKELPKKERSLGRNVK